MNLTQKQATLVDRSTGECMLLRSPFVVLEIALRSRGIGQIKAAACSYDASCVHLRRLSTTSGRTTFATFGSTSYLAPEAFDCNYDATATTTTSLATVAPNNTIAARARCAAANATSIASLVGISNSNWLGQSLLGNDISMISNIAFGSEADQLNSLGQAALSNPTPFNAIAQTASAIGASETGGLRLVQTASQDVWGNPQFYAKAISIAETGGAKALSEAFGVFSAAKLAFDAGAYAYAYANCGAGH